MKWRGGGMIICPRVYYVLPVGWYLALGVGGGASDARYSDAVNRRGGKKREKCTL